jgi:photosystem II stability/assembly factor-like uncharacterized protein
MTERLHLGTRKGLFTVARAGGGWGIAGAAFPGVEVSMLISDPKSRRMLAALGHGHFGVKFQRSNDGGATWSEILAPQYPQLAEGEQPDKCPMRGIEIPRRLEMVWSMEFGGDGTLWCGTAPGGLFKSADFGDSWTFVESLWNRPERKLWMGGGYDYPAIHSICVDPRDPKHVTLAVSCGGVWTTRDGGDTWTLDGKGLRNAYLPPEQAHDQVQQDVHRLVACAGDPRRMWIQHHNGIFRSDDEGATVTEIEKAGPSVFGFAVATHPAKPDTAWFVPAVKDEERIPANAAVVVTRTRDAGKSFDVLRNGLPQQHAYDLFYRHCLDVDASGDKLAIGSTTGSLWVSENQGDSWQHVSAHLPPIYCVRFEK